MSDLISRQKAIEALRECEVVESDNFTRTDPVSMMAVATIANCIEAIMELPSAESERKWIPVTEALPKMKEVVLITNGKGHVRCGKYQGIFDNKNYRWRWKHKTLEEVLAWMPLPESYKDE